MPLVDDLLGLRDRGELDALWLVGARFEGAGRYSPVRLRILPWPAPPADGLLPPSPYVDVERLRTIVSREYLYASLFETLLESLASEHGKRLVIAESARGWLEQRLEATRRAIASTRRESSTQEVLEVAAAARMPGRRR
jgi:F0F1-type ATP synthase gamma subunit